MILRLAVLILWIGSTAGAQTVTFRSGEHASFVRLVLAIPPLADWEVGRVAEGYGLRFPGRELDFDTAGVFDRIPRTRLRALQSEGGVLRLDLNCDCHVSAFLWQDDRLVIDIRDGPAPQDSVFEAQLELEENTGESTDLEPIAPILSADRVPLEIFDPQLLTRRSDVRSELSEFPVPFDLQLSQAEVSVQRAVDAGPPPQVDGLRTALIEGLARAATQGLLDPVAPTLATDTGVSVAPETDVTPSDVPAPAQQSAAVPGLVTATSIERAFSGRPDIVVRNDGTDCLDPELFDVQSWADSGSFFDQLAELRSELTTESETISPDGHKALARFYVHHGFGIEAIATLRVLDDSDVSTIVLTEMAHIVDGQGRAQSILTGQEECPSPAGLWAILGSEDDGVAAKADADSALRYLRTLPSPIRGFLGHDLAQKFVRVGDTTTAEAALSISRFDDTIETHEAVAVEAAISSELGENARAIRALENLAETDPRIAPEQVIGLIRLAVAEGSEVPEDVLALAEAIRFEHGSDKEIATDLVEAEIMGWLTRDDHARALALLRSTELLDGSRLTQISSETYLAVANGSPDDEFLTVAFGSIPEVDARAENRLAERLLELGFSDRAEEMFRSEARQEAARDRRLLSAQIAHARGDFSIVSQILENMNDEASMALRISALTAAGDHDAALVLARGDSSQDLTQFAWRAEAWSALSGEADPVLARISDQRLAAPSNLTDDPNRTPLAARRDLLAASAETRALAGELTARFPVSQTDSTVPSN